MSTTVTTPPGSLQPRVGLQPPKRLAALEDVAERLRRPEEKQALARNEKLTDPAP